MAAFVYSASFGSHFYYILCFMHFPRDECSRVLGQIINLVEAGSSERRWPPVIVVEQQQQQQSGV